MRTALRAMIVFTLLLGVAYPLAITGVAQLAFPWQANGSLLERGGTVVGSALIGVADTDPRDFWGRPSAANDDPAGSTPSNLGPANPELLAAVRAREAALHAADPGSSLPIPIDLVTASGSGLDPDISPEAARYQIVRVARARGLPEDEVAALVERHVETSLLGPSHVNVLGLNLELGSLSP